ncbi:glucose-1-phosphate adenylyltransferase [Providencia alcalifaciens]|uniref:glucose-1-phosphate adenylyltransferase n=1 Tax=Providencia alcalifaciens TaxID=126385 RepID=UPI001CC4A2C5|nr:glucose-1-phosphate adenylyltransferase [Providencia alcalifaciens]CAG9430544.1 Glucose-1-phosphate adenylyltransferase [Providencia alcalifaciens]
MTEKMPFYTYPNPISRQLLAKELPSNTVALILAGGKGSRLKALTQKQPKPSLHFGGKFRIIDFTLSNCINSGIYRVGILTQYYSHHLIQHIQHSWSFLNGKSNEFIEIFPAQQKLDAEDWYQGTADAIFQNLDVISQYQAKYIIVLAGDHIYKMDYSRMLLDHVEKGSQCTVACIEVPCNQASELGIMDINDDEQIINFIEKPLFPPSMPGKPYVALASMGVYVFDAQYLYQLLAEEQQQQNTQHDFGKNLIPKAVQQGKAWAHPFSRSCVYSDFNMGTSPYWRDVGTIDAYWNANIDLVAAKPALDMYDPQWSIRTGHSPLAPARFIQGESLQSPQITNTLINAGSIVEDAKIANSVIFQNVRVNAHSQLDACVILPDVSIGYACRLQRCIIDSGCVLPNKLVIGEDPQWDAQHFYRSEGGVVLVTQKMLDSLAA